MFIQLLSKESRLTEGQLRHYAQTASARYKVYEIEKRSGGTRTIEHPSRPLKNIQRWVNKRLLEKLPVHSSATAYSKGSGIKINAKLHSKSNYTVRLDFVNFFPSFRAVHIRKFLGSLSPKAYSLSSRDIGFLTKIFCRNGGLTIGAPSSPKLTNVMMYSFDQKMSVWCKENGLIYSRYADDIFVSSRKGSALEGVEKKVAEHCRDFRFAKLTVNKPKTLHLSRRYHRSVTGLVITTERKVSLGRDRKRLIRSLVYKHLTERLTADKYGTALGLLSFAYDVERTFYDSLAGKFSVHDVLEAMKSIDPKEVELESSKN